MKKTIILSVLGLTAAAVSSYGQGYIAFNTYLANSSAGIQTTFGNGSSIGTGLPNTFTGVLLYSTTQITDTASTALTAFNPLTAGWTVGSTGIFNTGGAAGGGGGYVTGPNLTVPGGTQSQVVYLELLAFNGTAWNTGSTYQGHSASFTANLAAGINSPDVNQINSMAPFQVFQAVPEPTTLALAGLGGLASLIALRRKQA